MGDSSEAAAEDDDLPGAKRAGVCAWVPSCRERSKHVVRSHTRPGLVLTYHVCGLHREIAVSQGWHVIEQQDGPGRGRP